MYKIWSLALKSKESTSGLGSQAFILFFSVKDQIVII